MTGFTERGEAIASEQARQLPKHETDRRYERRTVLVAAAVAAMVALIVAGSSSVGLALSAEINDSTRVSADPTAPTSGNPTLEIQTDILKLAEDTSALKLFVSAETYSAAQQVAKCRAAS